MAWSDRHPHLPGAARPTRRRILAIGGAIGAGLELATWPPSASAKGDAAASSGEAKDEVSPAEDLMREHGVLERILLIYEAALGSLPHGAASALPVMAQAAEITRRFVEDYHEKLEEEFLFPRFEKAGKLLDLVRTLRLQHDRGRALTDQIRRLAEAGDAAATASGSALASAATGFLRMYRPHAAREDTVLFPAFRALVAEKEYRELGERFEDREHQLFGARGFEGVVGEVAQLESTLGILDLNRFSPT